MNFNKHSDLEGKHAFLGASKYHWLNYDDAKIIDAYARHMATAKGTELHEFAARCIQLEQKLLDTNQTLNRYVNDAIGFQMKPEVVLRYSEYCFGTADAIRFADNFLRVHDLKTGVTPTDMKQLYIYVALFCLEYKIKPGEIQIECRIYQSDDVRISKPTAEDIVPIMNKIIQSDKVLRKINMEVA